MTNADEVRELYEERALDLIKPFLFEVNNSVTQSKVQDAFNEFSEELMEAGTITDYSIKCDDDNNTEERIGRFELWVDVAAQPSGSDEFVYIPLCLTVGS